jgi:hypothetical protein
MVTLKLCLYLYKTSNWVSQWQAKNGLASEGLQPTLHDLESIHDHVFLSADARSLASAAVLKHAGRFMAARL